MRTKGDVEPKINKMDALITKCQQKPQKYLIQAFFILLFLGLISCGLSREIALDPDSRGFYETARLIMSKQEKDIFNHLPDQKSREEFISDFWAKRDPDPDSEENEFREEFFRRIEYANQRFKEGLPGWKTDRGRMYIYLGPPDRFEDRPFLTSSNAKGIIYWIYYNQLTLEFIDERGDGRYTLQPYSGIYGSLFDALDRAKFGLVSIKEGFEGKFVDFDVEFNKEKKEIVVSMPITSLIFKEEDGIFKADFEFEFYIYEREGQRNNKFREIRYFEMPEEEVLHLKKLDFTFPYELEPGNYYFDVVIIGKPDTGKTRKIFKIKL